MSLAKVAENNFEDILEVEDLADAPSFEDVKPGEVVVLELAEEPKKEDDDKGFIFSLPTIPGSDDQGEFEVNDDDTLEAVSPAETDVEVEETDPMDWVKSHGHAKFLEWLKNHLENIPKHDGKSTTGIEKAISHLDQANREISKAIRSDRKNQIDSNQAEDFRCEIENGIDRLSDRLEKIQKSKFKRHKKKAEDIAELVKLAQKIPGIKGIVVSVPLLISRCARVCINGVVSAGHSMEELFDEQVKLYKLSIREQAELETLITDMGYQVMRDRGIAPDEGMRRSDQNLPESTQQFPD